jgi:hypothetical protein
MGIQAIHSRSHHAEMTGALTEQIRPRGLLSKRPRLFRRDGTTQELTAVRNQELRM